MVAAGCRPRLSPPRAHSARDRRPRAGGLPKQLDGINGKHAVLTHPILLSRIDTRRARSIIINNTRDLQGGELKFGHLPLETPAVFLKRWRNTYGNDDDSNP